MVNKKMMKRLSALLLTATLCISACPTNVAYATEVTETTVETTVEDTQTEQTGTEEQNVVAASEVETVAEVNELTDATVINNDEAGIPDKALYQYLLKLADGKLPNSNKDNILTYGELKSLSYFDYYWVTEEQPAINSFKNLSLYCPNLKNINYGYSSCLATERVIITQESMAEFKQLQEGKDNFTLLLYGAEMTQEVANVIGEMSNLSELTLSNCTIPSYDFLTSEKLAELENLDLGFNELDTIPNISHMTELTDLYLRDNNLTDLPDLTGMQNLYIDEMGLWENYLSKEVLVKRLPEKYATNTDFINGTYERQDKGLECDLTVDIESTELTSGTTVPMSVTVKNTGVDLENVLVSLKAADCTGIYLNLVPSGYTLEGDYVRIPALKHGETLTLQYKVTTGKDAEWKEDHVEFYAKAWYEADEYVSDSESSYETYEWINIKYEDSSTPGGSGDSEYYESLNLTIKEVSVSNNNIVVNNDTPFVTVDVSVAVEGPDVDKLENGMYLIATINGIDTSTGLSADRQLVYNAATKRFEGTIGVGGNTWKDGAHSIKAFALSTSYMWMEIPCETEFPLWTYTNNTTDKTSPVLNGVQVLINGVTQTSSTFALKQGDTITIRADITDDSRVDAVALLYPANWDALTTSQYMEMSNAGNLRLNMRATEYDLEAVKTLIAPFYAGEYKLYYISMSDAYSNGCTYFAEDIALLMKEVAKNPSNAGLVKNETLATELNKVASNIASLVAKEGAMYADVKAAVEAAIARGETISVDLTVSSVPASSINSKEREDIQKKADGVFGEATKLAFLNINMNIFANGANLGNLLELGEEISITVTLPQELQGDYYYKVIRYHEKTDGTVETSILDATKNADGTLTFKTDRFSTYAIAYSTNAPIGESPKTVDMEMTVLLLTLALSAMAAVVVSKKMRKTA